MHILTDEINRDCIAGNADVLRLAAQHVGFKASVKTFAVHVQALYNLMQIPVQRALECSQFQPSMCVCIEVTWSRLKAGKYAGAFRS